MPLFLRAVESGKGTEEEKKIKILMHSVKLNAERRGL